MPSSAASLGRSRIPTHFGNAYIDQNTTSSPESFVAGKVAPVPVHLSHFRIARCAPVLLWLCLALLGPVALFAQEGAVVRSISFQGNAALSSEVLRSVMLTYETGWFSETILGTDPYLFSDEVLQSDLTNVVAEYQREGFLNVRIDTVIVTTNDTRDMVSLAIHISEGVPIVTSSVDAEIPGDSLRGRTVQEVLQGLSADFVLQAGFRFRDADLIQDREMIQRALAKDGYAYARVEALLEVDTVRHLADVRWRILPGPLCRYGEVTIRGNELVPTSLLQEKVAFRPGDVYDSGQLEDLQQDIYALGQFQTVLVRPRFGEEAQAIIPIVIQVQEATRTKAKFGGGYGAEERLRAFVELKRLGFLGGARTITVNAKYSALTPLNTSVTFVQPDFLFQRLSLFIRPYVLFEKEIGYSVNRYGGDVTLERKLFRTLLTSLSYTLEQVRVPEGESVSATDPSIYNKSAVGLSLTYSTAQPIFDPVQGWFNALRLFYTGLPPSPEIEFVRVLYDSRRYDEVWGDVVLATRLKIGSIWAGTDTTFVPPEERFYAGGSYSVRGYSRNKLGPQDAYGNPLGGRSILEASAEFRFPLGSSFGLVAFVDAGNVWESTATYRLSEIEYAAGAGLRYETPVGPIRFDAARTVSEKGKPWEFHFSIGQAF